MTQYGSVPPILATPSVQNSPSNGCARRLASSRLWLSAFVLAAWLAAMFAVWRHESARGGRGLKRLGISPDVLLVTWTDYAQVLWIIQNGKPIGSTHMAILRREDPAVSADRLPGYEMSSRTRLKFRMFGLPLPIDMSMVVGMNGQFEMDWFQGTVLVAGRRLRLDAFAEGKHLYYRARIGPESAETPSLAGGLEALLAARDICGRAPVGGPILMHDVLLPLLIHEGKLKPGQSWSTETSDPIGGLLRQPVRVTVVGREMIQLGGKDTLAWHLTERVGEMQSQAYYGSDGQLLRRDAPGGLTMLRADAKDVRKFDPGFGRTPEPETIDRDYIRAHLDPDFTDKPLESLLPGLPSL